MVSIWTALVSVASLIMKPALGSTERLEPGWQLCRQGVWLLGEGGETMGETSTTGQMKKSLRYTGNKINTA